MRTWLRNNAEDLWILLRSNGQWWWDRRLRISDWCFAVFTLPFNGIMMMAGASNRVSLLSPFFPDDVGGVSLPWVAQMALGLGLLLFVAPTVLSSIAMLWRRSRPTWLMLLGLLILVVYANPIPLMVGLYSYPAYFGDRRRLAVWVVLSFLAMGILYGPPVNFLMLSVLYLMMPLVAGLWLGTRRQLIDRLKERAERLEREQHLKADQAIIAERTRIAHEMHDVVAHRVSLMVLHAGGLEVSAAEPRAVEAAGLIRTTGREALSELRNILGVLREDGSGAAPTAPQPVLDDLERLISEWRDAGMVVRRADAGEARPLPVAVQRTAFRTVQEGLTNAAKHATGAAVDVRLYRGDEQLEVEVANGPVTGPSAAPPRSGYGLTGLRERVALAGGELSAGACADGGWRLRAILPIGEEDQDAVPDPEPHSAEVEEEGTHRDPDTPGR